MERIATFEKVSYPLFEAEMKKDFPQLTEDQIRSAYDSLKLPKRSTRGSAGYDFYAPVEFVLMPGQGIRIPTGIRARMEEGWVLSLYPRSGLGFKYRLQLDNTVGIIDSDYFYSDNEGHIMARITNDSRQEKTVSVEANTGFIQGIFLPFGITTDDEAIGIRNGGFGSTTR
jgi:dUTP pyrophosphatase